METIKILECFGGIGACTKAFKNLNIPYEVVDYIEIDKYAVKSYNALNNTNFDTQDITKWDKDLNVDLIMHGSPCQDFSAAGLNLGGDENSGTRSSLMYETVRIIEKIKPKYVIWENVKNILNGKHKSNFLKYIHKMEELGYENCYEVLNAKDYNLPQNRERVFTISIRKDIAKSNNFFFPSKENLVLSIDDILEKNVSDKYYLSKAMKKYIVSNNDKWTGNNDKSLINKTITSTINTGEGSRRCDASNYICWELPKNTNIKYIKDIENYNIRKLTSRECWKLMGFTNDDFNKVEKINSDTQLRKQAGNSICVNVLERILEILLK